MIDWIKRYQFPLIGALGLHFLLICLFVLDPSSNERPVVTAETRNELGAETNAERELRKQPEIVKAEAVDQQSVMEAVERLKQTRQQAQEKIVKEQQALQRQAQEAQAARVAEQKRLQNIRAEEERIAIARKKAAEEDTKRLKKMAEQKAKEMKAIEALKMKQQALKIEQEKIKKDNERKQAVEAAAAVAAAKRDAEQHKQAEQAAQDAAQKARMMGEVNKYKAMILNAISRQWILPETVRPGLSSQFRIRLAPGGDVLEVKLTRSSGDAILDRSAQTAIYKASPLPVPSDLETFGLFKDISLTVRPESVRG